MGLLEHVGLVRLPRYRIMLLDRARMRVLLSLPAWLKRLVYYGRKHYCPICGSRLRAFMRFGHLAAEWCPVCASMRRHRFLWAFLQTRTNLFDGARKRLLHVAPEVALRPHLQRIENLQYVTTDLHDPSVTVRTDITQSCLSADAFDGIVCSHVLEHVADDRAAMREFARILRRDGWLMIMVPYRADAATDEDPEITDAAERERRFGQHDHVRLYGADLVDRLTAAGLSVRAITAGELLSSAHAARFGVDEDETLFLCSPATGQELREKGQRDDRK